MIGNLVLHGDSSCKTDFFTSFLHVNISLYFTTYTKKTFNMNRKGWGFSKIK